MRGGRLTVVHEAERVIRLGEGVDETRTISKAAMERLGRVLLTYRELAERHQAYETIVAGTSAARDARNQKALIDFVRRETGLTFQILSGEEEARWSFAGTPSAFSEPSSAPCLVLDVGGGSTELIVGTPGTPPTATHSLDVGSVRLTERFFTTQPASSDEIVAATALVLRMLSDVDLPLDEQPVLIGTGGTPVCLALVDGVVMDEVRTGRVTLSARTVQAWRERLFTLPYADVLDLAPQVMQGRADVFPAAVMILHAVLHHFGLPACRVSPHGLRHGLLLRRARELF